jgi:hypothetical protein
MADSKPSELDQLRLENSRLIALLEAHGIAWRSTEQPRSEPTPDSAQPLPAPQVQCRRRWPCSGVCSAVVTISTPCAGRAGAAGDRAMRRPARMNGSRGSARSLVWPAATASHRELLPVTDAAIYGHLAGEHTLGLYPLLENDTCHLLAVDFDEQDWREDAKAFLRSCLELAVPAALEISRSGEGAHAWVFFEEGVSAREARQLGAALISHTCAASRQLQLSSYDRLFPNQDTMPKGGFGNLIALPLQKEARQRGCSVFVDNDLKPYPDQWAYLATLQRLSVAGLQTLIQSATGGAHPLDLAFIDEEDLATPWKAAVPLSRLRGPLPASLVLTLSDRLYVERSGLPQPLLNRLIRLAAFANPAFYKAQAMRLSVWDKPRVIGCAENFPQHIALPRGCLEPVQTLLQEQGINWELVDERQNGSPLELVFTGQFAMTRRPPWRRCCAMTSACCRRRPPSGKRWWQQRSWRAAGSTPWCWCIGLSCCANGRSGSKPSLMSLLRRSVASVVAKPSPPANSTSP